MQYEIIEEKGGVTLTGEHVAGVNSVVVIDEKVRDVYYPWDILLLVEDVGEEEAAALAAVAGWDYAEETRKALIENEKLKRMK